MTDRSIFVKGVSFSVCPACQRAKPPSAKEGGSPYVYLGGTYVSPADMIVKLRAMADEMEEGLRNRVKGGFISPSSES